MKLQCISLYSVTPFLDIVTEDALVTRNFDFVIKEWFYLIFVFAVIIMLLAYFLYEEEKPNAHIVNPLSPNDVQSRRAVSPWKIKIPSKKYRHAAGVGGS
jgi:hypothetical protein